MSEGQKAREEEVFSQELSADDLDAAAGGDCGNFARALGMGTEDADSEKLRQGPQAQHLRRQRLPQLRRNGGGRQLVRRQRCLPQICGSIQEQHGRSQLRESLALANAVVARRRCPEFGLGYESPVPRSLRGPYYLAPGSSRQGG